MGAASPLSHRRPIHTERFHFGAAYYPEHWEPEYLKRDAQRMREAGFNLVRLAEFSWHLLEVEEGRFDFAWLDHAISVLAEEGIDSMLCTPTAAPPRWLTRRYPQVLREDAHGRRMQHGSRQHASHFSEEFRVCSRHISEAMAQHYARNEHVLGWQTDNEFHCHFAEDHCEAAQQAFRDFLKLKYQGDLHALNHAWGTGFWAQHVDSFDDILTPRAEAPTHQNPSQVLDYQRFLSWGVTRFQQEQVEILRRANPEWWITHNGCFGSIDYRGPFTEELDFLSYDSYPFFDLDPGQRRFSHSFNLDYVRAYSGNFMVLEQQSGPGGQTGYLHDTPEPGELRRMAYASIAHGADGLLFFRWRSCRFGAEEYWCGILDHDDVPRRRYREVKQLGEELQRIAPELLGSSVHIDVAVAAVDFDAQAAHHALHHGLPGPRQAAEELHRVFHEQGFATGVVHPAEELSGISLCVIPHMPLFKAEWVPGLEAWVREGGTLVVGPRTATKDEHNQVLAETAPGCLRELCGVQVQEMGRQNRPDLRPLTLELGGEELQSDRWYEQLQVDEGVDCLARWNSRHLSGSAAISCRRLGEGRVIYSGSWLNAELMQMLIRWLQNEAGLMIPESLAPGVERVIRKHPDGRELHLYLQHGEEAAYLSLPAGMKSLIGDVDARGGIRLEASGVCVFLINF